MPELEINILAVFTKKVPLNSQAFLGIRICDKIIFRHGHFIQITLKFEVTSFEPEKVEMESGARFLAFSILSVFLFDNYQENEFIDVMLVT